MFWQKKKKSIELESEKEGKLDYLVRLIEEKFNSNAEQQINLEKRQKRQGNALEELLDLQEETQEELKEIREYVQEGSQKQQLEEQKLISLIMKYDDFQEQICMILEGSLGKEESWKQKELMERVLEPERSAIQLQKIKGDHLPVDFAKMEVIQAEEVPERTKQNIVKRTIVPGWIYKGKIIQKAKVEVYRYKEDVCQK